MSSTTVAWAFERKEARTVTDLAVLIVLADASADGYVTVDREYMARKARVSLSEWTVTVDELVRRGVLARSVHAVTGRPERLRLATWAKPTVPALVPDPPAGPATAGGSGLFDGAGDAGGREAPAGCPGVRPGSSSPAPSSPVVEADPPAPLDGRIPDEDRERGLRHIEVLRARIAQRPQYVDPTAEAF